MKMDNFEAQVLPEGKVGWLNQKSIRLGTYSSKPP